MNKPEAESKLSWPVLRDDGDRVGPSGDWGSWGCGVEKRVGREE